MVSAHHCLQVRLYAVHTVGTSNKQAKFLKWTVSLHNELAVLSASGPWSLTNMSYRLSQVDSELTGLLCGVRHDE